MNNNRKKASAKKSEISREKLLETYKKKLICNEKAQRIVESLIDKGVSREDFLLKVNYINQSHYDDIIEERSINNLCGYPLCDEILNSVPHQQYIILLKTNKVYDITERKKYCCTQCFKSSQYIKEQILTSPLWLRNEKYFERLQLLDEIEPNRKHSNRKIDISNGNQ